MTDNIADLEQLIGTPPYGAYVDISVGSRREFIKTWLKEHGMVAFRADNMRDGTLAKCYIQPGYLKNLLTRSDYTVAPGLIPPATRPVETMVTGRDPIDATLPKPAAHSKEAALLAAIAAMAQGDGVDEARIIELIKLHAPKGETHIVERIINYNPATGESNALPDGGLRHQTFGDVFAAVQRNIPVMLVGPAGAGKTTLAHQIAKAMNASHAHIGAITSRFELSGYKDAQGAYQGTPFRDAFEFGGHFLLDECDGSDPSVFLWLNNALANDSCAFPDGVIDRHDDFRIIAAANTYGRGADRIYVGRNQLDGASLDRFAVIDFDYDETLEKKAFGDGPWTRKVQAVRKAIGELGIRHVVSPRATKFGWELLDAGLAEPDVERMTIWKGLDKDTIAKVRAHV